MDCYEAADRFADIVEDLGISMRATRLPEETGAQGVIFLPFMCSLLRDGIQLHEKWSAGEGIAYRWALDMSIGDLRKTAWRLGMGLVSIKDIRQALNHGTRRTLMVEDIRANVRQKWEPETADVLHSFVLDAQYADDPDEFGALFSDPVEAIRAWQRVQVTAPATRRLFGSRWAEAEELACMM